ncbi:uncharacterized protein MYCFIDRAFT_192023 [Pseudocercospora fijiensis CIRAD86]|uniref:Uncharacterized protein n=1 Tax=Pseudocercospora fijiensis (strain CIRAD86) TaxID=383855 RepID=N1Q9U1_PSEFD|nr:uncharacterized protein MYCFIDRAFT_192023 [Pseudocercospora fijiensis CIRAD86]EME87652.1 hypothetical protein MYCFIDRAFT_192023 [Pseudocercospora fijiensis CIRAD86]
MDDPTFGHDQQETGVAPSSPYELIAFKNTVTPADALKKLEQWHDGFSNVEIQRSLRRIAITLYGHQKLAYRFQTRMHSGRNILLYFICAIHRCRAPSNVQEAMNMKRLAPVKMVGIYYFDCLYYAIIADIRRLQADVEDHLSRHPNSTVQLHNYGRDCEHINDPFTMRDLGELLEEFWVLLTDHRLLGPLETVVRTKSYADLDRLDLGEQEQEKAFIEEWEAKSAAERNRILERSRGMYDMASKTSEEVMNILWAEYAPKIEMACPQLNIEVWRQSRVSIHQQQEQQEEQEQQSGLAPIEQQQQPAQAETNVQAPAHDEDDSAPQYPPCTCSDDCHCKVACEYGVGECQCQFRRRYAAHQQTSRNLFDAPTNEVAQLEVATAAVGKGRPHMRQAVQFLTDATNRRRGLSRPEPYRGRSTTIQNLHNVPDGLVSLRPAARTAKDIYPLGLYGERETGGRFPPFPTTTTTTQQPRPLNSTGQATQSFSYGTRPASPAQPTEAELLPPLPFNSPPRATQQRYVVAGGNKRLSQRESIEFTLGEVQEEGVSVPRIVGQGGEGEGEGEKGEVAVAGRASVDKAEKGRSGSQMTPKVSFLGKLASSFSRKTE